MRGFPPVQIFLLCLAFAVLAIPLTHLTGRTRAQELARPRPELRAKNQGGTQARLRLRYAHVPTSISVKIGEQVVIAKVEAAPVEATALLNEPRDGVDVFVVVEWPEGTPDTAVTLEVEPDGLETQSQTLWSSSGKLDEVVTYKWK